MSTCWLREINNPVPAYGTGIEFYFKCLAFFLTKICGFTNFVDGTEGAGTLSSTVAGTNGEFNISGSDKNFRDTVAGSFTSGMVGDWIVIADSNRANAGIYKITAFISSTTVTVDFRSGATEYPVQTTGVDWWVIDAAATAATGTITGKAATSITDGDWIRVDGGSHIDDAKVLIFSTISPGGYTPNQWRGGVTATADVDPNNTLVGKTLNFSVGGVSKSCTFTGSNPLSISSIVSQINTAAGETCCYQSGGRGYASSYGKRLTWRVQNYGVWGRPQDPPSADRNEMQLTYSGSTAWTELGLEGTSNLTAPNLTQSHGVFDNVADPDIDDATEVAAWIAGQVDSAVLLDASSSTPTVNVSNTLGGEHGNKAIESVGFSFTGMAGGTMAVISDSLFRCRTPHTNGWEIEVLMVNGEYLGCNFPYAGDKSFEIRVSVNADWSFGSGKILGPVRIGTNYLGDGTYYAFGDDAGEYVTLAFRNTTGILDNGVMVGHIEPADSSMVTTEKIALMGNGTSVCSSSEMSRRTDLATVVGRGYVWCETSGGQVETRMADYSYKNASESLTAWVSREQNARKSQVFSRQDLIAGTWLYADPENTSNLYALLGRLVGHYYVRSNLSLRAAFDESANGAKDFFHMVSGIAFEWPGVTPQF